MSVILYVATSTGVTSQSVLMMANGCLLVHGGAMYARAVCEWRRFWPSLVADEGGVVVAMAVFDATERVSACGGGREVSAV